MRLLYSAGAPASGCPKNGHGVEYAGRTGAVQRGGRVADRGSRSGWGTLPGEVVGSRSGAGRTVTGPSSLLANDSVAVAHVVVGGVGAMHGRDAVASCFVARFAVSRRHLVRLWVCSCAPCQRPTCCGCFPAFARFQKPQPPCDTRTYGRTQDQPTPSSAADESGPTPEPFLTIPLSLTM